jgi:hypothetical protein
MTGSYNTAIGRYSLNANTSGNYNTASGYQALRNNAEGYDNTTLGVYALTSNTSGFPQQRSVTTKPPAVTQRSHIPPCLLNRMMLTAQAGIPTTRL